MSISIEDRVKEIFMAVFTLEDQDISSLTRENYEKWDSMAQTSLAICIEEEFNISLDFDTVEELDSFEYIVAFLEAYHD
ncbi:acyl carrier protein [Gammaproteobacteria bacterium]|nr:acyl carrier protein [Gammaproteobacteria bacterium]